MKTVMFCGHSKVNDPEKVREWLYEQVEEKIKEGATEFFLGGYGEFDNLAACVVNKLKKQYPNVSSVLVLAYPSVKKDCTLYDGSVYPPLENVPRKYAIVKRNKWMVDNSDVVIAYVLYDWGGAAKTLEYATKNQKIIVSYSK